MTPGPTVVARRWDGLGARLNALVNAWSVARALDLRFRFVWPASDDPALDDPRELFAERFLSAYAIPPLDESAHVVRADRSPLDLVSPGARERVSGLGPASWLEIVECYDVVALGGESPDDARARFRACARDVEWSAEMRAVADGIAHWDPEDGAGLHVRAGDLVSGAWRHLVMHDKYVPAPFITFAIETLAGGRPVLVVSDNEPYVTYLKRRGAAILTPRDVVPGYPTLTAAQRALANLLLLSRCRCIAGPPRSAFSRAAANLGGGRFVRADHLLPEGSERELLRRGIEDASRALATFGGFSPLLARDLCWFLDVFGDTLTPAERVRHAGRALRLEPDFCGALNRYARAAALAGRERAAGRASGRALEVAASVTRHHDPLLESLATRIAIACLSLGRRTSSRKRLPALKEALARCERLSPYQIHHDGILLHLRYQVAALEWLAGAGAESGERARRVLAARRGDARNPGAWRRSGLDTHRSSAEFDPVVRDLDEVSIRFARAIGAAPEAAAPGGSARVLGHVDGVVTSVSGLRWLCGWAVDAQAPGQPLAVRLSGSACGGPTFAAREDVAAALGDPRALESGFWFPLPCEVSEISPVIARTTAGADAALTPP